MGAEDRDARTQDVKVSYPCSPEVIEQEARHLQGLWLDVAQRRRKAHRALTAALNDLSLDADRTYRVSLTWASDAVDPIRHEFSLDDPTAGISLETVDKPRPGEQAVAQFLNAVLRQEDVVARNVVIVVMREFGVWELRVFLSLLLAVSVQGRLPG